MNEITSFQKKNTWIRACIKERNNDNNNKYHAGFYSFSVFYLKILRQFFFGKRMRS